MFFFFLIFPFTDPPLDKVPAQNTPGEQVLQQHSKTAKTLLGDFNLNEAGKLVQKRRPATSILDEELLLSEDETETAITSKKAAAENETKEVAKASPMNVADNSSQSEKVNMKSLGGPMRMSLQSSGGGGGGGGGGVGAGGNQPKRRRTMNRPESNPNRQSNNGPMNMNMNMSQNEPMGRDDLFMRKRNFMESDMGFDRSANDRGFPSMGGGSNNFMNDRNINNNMNSNSFGNNRDFGDEFSRRPGKNDGFSNFGNRSGANGGGNSSGGGGGNNNNGGGRMFNRY